jgi:hypothetical protein
MADFGDNGTKPSATQSRVGATSQESMEFFFFNLFKDNFMNSIGKTRIVLEQKHPGMLSDIITNIHKLSDYAADMVQRQGLIFKDLVREEQDIFVGEFLRQINVFAEKVKQSFDEITPDQEKKLLEAYAKPRPTDN